MTRRWTSNEWWNAVIGRSIRTIWHWVGFYAVFAAISPPLARALVVGANPAVMSVPVHQVLVVVGTLGLAVLLSVARPSVSSARTLAFGIVGAVSFTTLMLPFGGTDTVLSGRPLVVLDIALAGIAATTLAAAVALEFEPDAIRTPNSD